jgi:hypothetical protein
MEFFRINGYSTEKSSALYPTTPQVFFRYPTMEENFSVVGYNGGFPPLSHTMEEVFLHCGIQRKRFFSIVGHNGEKLYNAE